MRKLILSWILVAVSAAGCASYHNRTKTPPPPDPFEMVCEELKVECDFAPPIIVMTRLVDWVAGGVIGAHIGSEPYVFVRPEGPHVWKTTLHEVVHYVAWQEGLASSQCESEEMARVVASRLTNTEVDSTWAERYGCTR